VIKYVATLRVSVVEVDDGLNECRVPSRVVRHVGRASSVNDAFAREQELPVSVPVPIPYVSARSPSKVARTASHLSRMMAKFI